MTLTIWRRELACTAESRQEFQGSTGGVCARSGMLLWPESGAARPVGQKLHMVLQAWGSPKARAAASSPAPRKRGLQPPRRSTSAEEVAQGVGSMPHVLAPQATALVGARAGGLILLGRPEGVLCEKSCWWRRRFLRKDVRGRRRHMRAIDSAAALVFPERHATGNIGGAVDHPHMPPLFPEHTSRGVLSATSNFVRRGRLFDGQGEQATPLARQEAPPLEHQGRAAGRLLFAPRFPLRWRGVGAAGQPAVVHGY